MDIKKIALLSLRCWNKGTGEEITEYSKNSVLRCSLQMASEVLVI